MISSSEFGLNFDATLLLLFACFHVKPYLFASILQSPFKEPFICFWPARLDEIFWLVTKLMRFSFVRLKETVSEFLLLFILTFIEEFCFHLNFSLSRYF